MNRSRSTAVAAGLALCLSFTAGCAGSKPPSWPICMAAGALVGGGTGAGIGTGQDLNRGSAAAVGAVVGAGLGWLVCRIWATEVEEPKPRKAAPAPAPARTPPAVSERIVLRGVNFDFNQATIRPDAAVVLDEAANQLRSAASVDVRIEGHTDATGNADYNQKLSEERAQSVRRYLIGRGISAGRLTTVGYGESRPIASNDTADGRSLNRRVELKILN